MAETEDMDVLDQSLGEHRNNRTPSILEAAENEPHSQYVSSLHEKD